MRLSRPLRRIAVVTALVGSLLPLTVARAAVTVTGNAFDTCAAPSVSTMTAWLSSPYASVNIYIGGANRACGDGNLSSSWVASVEALGWKLIPTYVGLQAPCVAQGGLATIDPAQAAAEATSSADDAVARARNFGLGPSTPIYFDMEAYGADPQCAQTVELFVSSWAAEIHASGYLAGVYGSSGSTITNEAAVYNNPGLTRVDDIWFANWNGNSSVYGDPFFSDSVWTNHHRLHQFAGGHDEAWGAVTINIDSDYTDGDLAGQLGAGWSPWLPTIAPAGGLRAAPAVASWGPGRLDLFALGRNGDLQHTWSNNLGRLVYGWEDVGAPPGGITAAPAAVSWGPNRIDVFVRGVDSALWHIWWDGTKWVGWERLGGILLSAPAVAAQGPFHLDVFGVGTDRGMWHTSYDGAWHPFNSLGGYCIGDPGTVSWGGGRLDVFTLGINNVLWHQWSPLGTAAGTWSGWQQEIPSQWASGPGASSWGPVRVDVFLAESIAGGDPLGHVWYDGSWHVESLGGVLASDPSAVSWAPNRVDVFTLGTDGNIWHRWYGF
jgi:hypothetical protein